jgi:hypothetical protein
VLVELAWAGAASTAAPRMARPARRVDGRASSGSRWGYLSLKFAVTDEPSLAVIFSS